MHFLGCACAKLGGSEASRMYAVTISSAGPWRMQSQTTEKAHHHKIALDF